MLRTLFAIVSGLFAMMIVITFIELADTKFMYPPPAGLDWHDKQAVAAFAASLPTTAQLVVLAGWLLGVFVGAAVTARIANLFRLPSALLIGTAVVLGTIQSALEMPHPAWVVGAGVLLPLPLAWLAVRLFNPILPSLPEPKAWPKDAKAD